MKKISYDLPNDLRLKLEQNKPLEFALKTYISRFCKKVSKYFVNDCILSLYACICVKFMSLR